MARCFLTLRGNEYQRSQGVTFEFHSLFPKTGSVGCEHRFSGNLGPGSLLILPPSLCLPLPLPVLRRGFLSLLQCKHSSGREQSDFPERLHSFPSSSPVRGVKRSPCRRPPHSGCVRASGQIKLRATPCLKRLDMPSATSSLISVGSYHPGRFSFRSLQPTHLHEPPAEVWGDTVHADAVSPLHDELSRLAATAVFRPRWKCSGFGSARCALSSPEPGQCVSA